MSLAVPGLSFTGCSKKEAGGSSSSSSGSASSSSSASSSDSSGGAASTSSKKDVDITIGTLTYCVLEKSLPMVFPVSATQQLVKGIIFLIVVALTIDHESLKVIK